ncbi:hypothetical protein [Streptomyces sp. NK08204]|uniref:hypothetical protein n=1 Tax=Streptomyces sp. NK08204 TaxID=2873260 RepID=UPI001CEE07FD|nr:hypothetical protein [Streptomyces sp. NK08204]
MSLTFGRRATAAAVTLVAAVGTLLTAGGMASAAPAQAAGHTAVAVSHEQHSAFHGNVRGDRDNDRWYRGDRDDRDNGRWYRGDRHTYRVEHDWDSRGWHHHHNLGGRREFRGEHRWDGHRIWQREGRDWYSYDYGRSYRYDGHRFYRWHDGVWIVVIGDAYGFDKGLLH